jgi:hypothetical protein
LPSLRSLSLMLLFILGIYLLHHPAQHDVAVHNAFLPPVLQVLENLSVAPDVVNQAIDIVMSMRWVFGCESEEDVKARQGS